MRLRTFASIVASLRQDFTKLNQDKVGVRLKIVHVPFFMSEHAPNFLTCPGVPELPAPEGSSSPRSPSSMPVTPASVSSSSPPRATGDECLSAELYEHPERIHYPPPLWARVLGWVTVCFIVGVFSWFAYGVVRIGLAISVVRTSLREVQRSAQAGISTDL